MFKLNKKINIILIFIFIVLLNIFVYTDINSTNDIITSKVEYMRPVEGIYGEDTERENKVNLVSGENCKFISELSSEYLPIIYIIVPIILILIISISYAKAVMASDAEALKKAHKSNIRRVVAGVILLTLPFILKLVFELFGIEFCI